MDKLQELSAKHSMEVEAIPKFYAFGDEQFEEGYKKFQEDYPETINEPLVAIVGGCYTTEKYGQDLVELFKRQHKETQDLLGNDLKLLKNAFYQEMYNVEFCYGFEEDNDIIQTVYHKNYEDLTPEEKKTYHEAKELYMTRMSKYGF